MVRNAASVRAVGFGQNNSKGNAVIGFKFQVNIVIASYQCDGTTVGIADEQVYRCKSPYEMVAAGLNRDTCGGDSGGPIYAFAADTKPYLVAVTSRAVDRNLCGPGGIYVVLGAPPIRAWLEAHGGVVFNDGI
jgi:secreted trypsin-like serine protease